MATVNEKMTALADEIRTLSGTTTTKSIDAMTSDVNVVNAEIAEQAELLEQIATALEGKAGGSGGAIETCMMTLSSEVGDATFYYTDENMTVQQISTSNASVTAAKDTLIVGKCSATGVSYNIVTSGCTRLQAITTGNNYLWVGQVSNTGYILFEQQGAAS